MALQWIGLCAAAAIVCTLLRPQHPELATVIALAAGGAGTAALANGVTEQLPRLRALWEAFKGTDQDIRSAVLRGAGLAVVSDFAAQLCRDAAQKVYDFLGVPDRNVFHIRPGIHDFNREDWAALIDFCDIVLHRERKLPHADGNRGPYVIDVRKYAPWAE